MKSFFRVCTFLVCFVVMATISVSAFSDVVVDSEQGKAIARMQEKGFVNGFEDGTFRPDATLTRAEFVKIINQMYLFYVEAENTFSDVKESDWFCHDVLAGVQAGYIRGMGNGCFAPNEQVTREQVCVILNSLLNLDKPFTMPVITDKVSDWARDSVNNVLGLYIFTTEAGGKFRATEPITRGEVCVALEKCIPNVDFEERFEPFDLEKLAKDELERKLKRIIACMENVIIPTYTDENVVLVGTMVVDSMKEYLKDSSFDYVEAAKATYEVYRKFNKEKADMFKNPIYENIELEDMAILFDFFYTPELDFIN